MTHLSCPKSSPCDLPTQKQSISRLVRMRASRSLECDRGTPRIFASWRYPRSRQREIMKLSLRMQILERTRRILSVAPVARSLPSGLKHTLLMYRSCILSAVSSTKVLPGSKSVTVVLSAVMYKGNLTRFSSQTSCHRCGPCGCSLLPDIFRLWKTGHNKRHWRREMRRQPGDFYNGGEKI